MPQWTECQWRTPDVPTMVTRQELQYLHWLTATQWSGRFDIVEIGPWLGATTIALAAGMLDNSRRSTGLLHTIDNFVWRPFMSPRSGLQLSEGDDFSEVLRSNLGVYEPLVRLHRASLPDGSHRIMRFGPPCHHGTEPPLLSWTSQSPIEILFIDGAKSWDAMTLVLALFGQDLVPRSAFVVCQDFADPFAYWVPLLMTLNARHWSLAHVLPKNTATFSVHAQPPDQPLQIPPLDEVTTADGLELIHAAADAVAQRGNAYSARMIRLGACIFLADKHSDDEAAQALRASCWHFPLLDDSATLREVSEAISSHCNIQTYPPALRAIRRAAHLARQAVRGAKRRIVR